MLRSSPLLLLAISTEISWSAFYDVNQRRPDLTHMLPPYVAKQYSCVPGVGEVGWGEGVVTPASAMLSIST